MNVASLEIEAGRPETAMLLLQKAVTRAPADAKVWMNFGLALRQLKRYEEALAAFQMSMDLNPAWILPPTYMGSVYYEIGRHTEGIAPTPPILQRVPNMPMGISSSVSLRGRGRLSDAAIAYEKLIRLSPDKPPRSPEPGQNQAPMDPDDTAVATLDDAWAAFPGIHCWTGWDFSAAL